MFTSMGEKTILGGNFSQFFQMAPLSEIPGSMTAYSLSQQCKRLMRMYQTTLPKPVSYFQSDVENCFRRLILSYRTEMQS